MTFATAKEALAAWDAGEIVTTVELGGLGPGYEQAIQVLAFEIIRDWPRTSVTNEDKDEFQALADKTVHRIDDACCGFSGAQVGAATWLAFQTLRDGWETVLVKAREKDQTTMVSRSWPHVDLPVETHV